MTLILSNGTDDHNPARAAAAAYLDRGWVPVPTDGKRAVLTGWPDLAIEDARGRLPELWPDGTGRGVGLLLGAPSGGLVDVDCDCPEARRAAAYLLPPTHMVGGRAAAADSHWWYRVGDPPAKASAKYSDPVTRATLVELRSTGGQTCVPPTLLPAKTGTGQEPVVWRGGVAGEPAAVDIVELTRYVAALAAVALLARHWPDAGGRHDANLALAGGLVRDGLRGDAAEAVIRALGAAAGDEEVDDRVRGVASTAARAADAADTTGWPTLARLLGGSGEAIARTARRWLGLGGGAGPADAPPAPPDHDRAEAVHDVTLAAAFDTPKRSRVAVTRGGALVHLDRIDLDAHAARTKFVAAAAAAAWPDEATRPPDARDRLAAAVLVFAADPPTPAWVGGHDVAAGGAGDAFADQRPAALAATPADVVADAEALLRDPGLIDRIAADIALAGVTGERDLAVTLYLVGTSTQLPRPLSAIVIGATSSGKSYTVNVVQELFPPEVKLNATDLTANALYYMPEGSLHHRWVVAGERSRVEGDERAEAKRGLREMLESQVLRKLVATTGDGTPETRLIEQRGPIAFVESTTNSEIFDEDRNRSLSLFTDESREQTAAVLARTAELAAGGSKADVSRVVAVHHALQRMIPRTDVVIPYAAQLAAQYPAHRVDARRAFRHLLQTVKAVALVHFRQRERDAAGRVVATPADYRTAATLAEVPLAVAMEAMSAGARTFYGKLRARWKVGEWFTATQAVDATACAKSSAHRYLSELADACLVEVTRGGAGRGTPGT